MRLLSLPILFGLTAIAPAAEPALVDAPKPPDGFPRFKVQEIDTGLKIGYAVITSDIDGDTKPDLVVVDQHRVVWYQNPTWKKRVILDGKTKPDNVCITALDVTGDKLPELVLGAGWKPFDTKNPGTLQWLKRGKSLDDEWTMHEIPCDEPMVHRVRSIDLDGDDKPEVVMAPLMGRDATREKNWMDGRPVRIVAYKVPAKEPEKAENWKPEVISDTLHVVHNFDADREGGYARKGTPFLAVSYEGLHLVHPEGKFTNWTTRNMHEANQENASGSRGASEVRRSHDQLGAIATVEPWHGNQIVVYTPGKPNPEKAFSLTRSVIDDHLHWGHALAWTDLDLDGKNELVVGVRDNPTKDDTFTEKRGVRIYRYDEKAKKWDRYILEDGGVAVEDLTVADLNADGKPDIVAVGRATGNARIYWNQGK